MGNMKKGKSGGRMFINGPTNLGGGTEGKGCYNSFCVLRANVVKYMRISNQF